MWSFIWWLGGVKIGLHQLVQTFLVTKVNLAGFFYLVHLFKWVYEQPIAWWEVVQCHNHKVSGSSHVNIQKISLYFNHSKCTLCWPHCSCPRSGAVCRVQRINTIPQKTTINMKKWFKDNYWGTARTQPPSLFHWLSHSPNTFIG